MSGIHFNWQREGIGPFMTGVSLHSHTLHSRESLDFVQKATVQTPVLSGIIRKHQSDYRAVYGTDLDLKRAWWTPPLMPCHAFDVERRQLEGRGLNALVSLSDHDTMDACLQLSLTPDARKCPVSVEWTVPFRGTFFHVGVHNVVFERAGEVMREMRQLTARPDEADTEAFLEYLACAPQTLIILNHPLWDESRIGDTAHRIRAVEFLHRFMPAIHALELNGLRRWQENRDVIRMAESLGKPVVSGGDRHGKQGNACINLTNALTFDEFVEEVRAGSHSDILFLDEYREPLAIRVLESIADVLEDYPEHGMGWRRWTDRVFYEGDDGVARSVTELCGKNVSPIVDRAVALMPMAKSSRLKFALRLALARNGDAMSMARPRS